MSLKTSFREAENNRKQFETFPAIGRGKINGIIVYFTAKYVGFVISNGTGLQQNGYSANVWDMSCFTEIFDGELTFKKEQP